MLALPAQCTHLSERLRELSMVICSCWNCSSWVLWEVMPMAELPGMSMDASVSAFSCHDLVRKGAAICQAVGGVWSVHALDCLVSSSWLISPLAFAQRRLGYYSYLWSRLCAGVQFCLCYWNGDNPGQGPAPSTRNIPASFLSVEP